MQTQTLYTTEYRVRAKDGSYSYFNVRGVPVLAADGSVREWVGTCTDISSRIASEEALKARAEELAYLTAVLARTNAVLEKRNH